MATIQRSGTYHDILALLAQPGCPVCTFALAGVERYVESIDYEAVNDPGFRGEIEPAQGFCNRHAVLWLGRAHPLGTALIYDAVLTRLAEPVDHLEPRGRHGFRAVLADRFEWREDERECAASEVLPIEGHCPVCKVQHELEQAGVAAVFEGVAAPAFAAAYRASMGLCLPHVRAIFETGEDGVALAVVREVAGQTSATLRRQLAEIVRKHDYRFRSEPAGDERGAVERAVHHVAGAPGLGHR